MNAGVLTAGGAGPAPAPAPAPAATVPFEPLDGWRRLAATLALAMAAFMNILDLTIANVSVPTIAGAMGVSATQGTWIVTSYAVSEAILLPLTGWLAARLGQRRMFTVATVAFTLASLCCALSLSFPMLLAARVLQGAVGAAMIPLAQAMLLSIYPPHKRGTAMGIFSMTTVAAPIIGPLAGGWITDHLSWHWIFLVNLPVGLLCIGLVGSLLGRYETERRRVPVDTVGMLLLAVGVGSLQIALDKGNELDWFSSGLIVGLLAVAGLTLLLFVVWTLTSANPVVALQLFARRNYAVGVGALAVASVAFFGTNIVVPLWLQTHMGYSAEWAGRTMAFGGVLAVVLGPVIGSQMHRMDARAVATFGLLMFALFAVLSARFPPNVDFWTLATTRLILGVGLSCLFLPLNTIYLSGLTAEQTAGAAGLASFMRNLGSSFGTSLMTSLWAHKTTAYSAQLAESVSNHNPAAASYLHQLSQLGLPGAAGLGYVRDVVIGTQASLLATNAVLFVSAGLMLALVGVVWFARPPFGAGKSSAMSGH